MPSDESTKSKVRRVAESPLFRIEDSVRCCIVGGGPAGMFLGLLLARGGVEVAVLEKHADFLRDFRGDTVHSSTLDVLDDMGLGVRFAELPQTKVRTFEPPVPGMKPVRFDELPVRHPYIAFVPQWDLLNLLADEGSRLPNFSLRMQAEATELVHSNGRVVGVRYGSPSGSGVVRADLTVGADGRNSIVREGAGLKVAVDSPPMDVLWFRLPRVPGDGDAVFMRIAAGTLGIFLNRGDYWQIGLAVPKGTADELRSTGIGGLRARVATMEPRFRDRLDAISGWDQVALLTVRSDRVRPWWAPGLLLIGDAAHAMSPIGGVGINLAVQDAVATANLLGQLLAGSGEIPDGALELVQRRREPPTRSTQQFQERLQRQVLSPVLGSRPSPILKILPALFSIRPVRRAFMRRILVGYRPERVLWPSTPPSA